jgi:hypothetical protein
MEPYLHTPIRHDDIAAPVNVCDNLRSPHYLPLDKLSWVVTPHSFLIYDVAPILESNTRRTFLITHSVVMFWVASYKYRLCKLLL